MSTYFIDTCFYLQRNVGFFTMLLFLTWIDFFYHTVASLTNVKFIFTEFHKFEFPILMISDWTCEAWIQNWGQNGKIFRKKMSFAQHDGFDGIFLFCRNNRRICYKFNGISCGQFSHAWRYSGASHIIFISEG